MTSFPEGPQRNRALSYFTAVSSAGGSIGLILGGMLTSWVSWRWALFINVPIGIASFCWPHASSRTLPANADASILRAR